MKVTISEVSTARDAIMASGLSLWIEGMGVTVDAPPSMLQLSMQPVAAPMAIADIPVALPSKRAYKKAAAAKKVKAAKPGKAVKSTPASEEPTSTAPRVTIRSRIKEVLTSGPMSARDLADELNRRGVNTSHHLIGQHLYLMSRDGLTQHDEANIWSLK